MSKNIIDPEIIVDSPGRINFIGEHTDYNMGFVLPTAIDKRIIFKFKKNGSRNECSVYSSNYDVAFNIDLNDVKISKIEWENYILGVLSEIQKLTNKLEGFVCSLSSDLPVGSGISSSAALECGFAFGLNELFDLGLSKMTIVKLSQRAEHNYVGTKCGIMDQYSSVMSKENHVILLDCQNLEHEFIPMEIQPYKVLLLNTKVAHSLASSEYNNRRQECQSGVRAIQKKYPLIKSLRDVNEVMLEAFKSELDEVIYKRCKYVLEEEERVLLAVSALKEKRLIDFGALMYATHEGLSNQYEVSCPELDFLVDFSKNYEGVIGSRMMGGGFGGCTINLVHEDILHSFIEEAADAYKIEFDIDLDAFEANPRKGTTLC